MAAQPVIVTTAASKDNSSTLIQVLLRTNARGMVQIRGYLSSLCTTEDTAMRTDWCVEQQNTTYISNLYQLVNAYKPATTTALSACVRTYACASEEDCDTLTCETWNSGYTSEKTSIAMESVANLTPLAVSDLTLIPGNENISVSWGNEGSPTSWTFEIILLQGTTQLVHGFVTQTSRIINNLTNGTEYTFKIRIRSYDGYNGPWTSMNKTPSSPKWKCSDAATNTCVRDDVNGTFLSEALCKAASSCQICTPNWQCESPLNGYEADGCGNRRLNDDCNVGTPKWKCSDAATNTCVRDDVNGTFLSEALCKAASSCQICTPNWQTGSWGECQPDSTQSRTVTDLNNCGVDTGKPATVQSCTYVPCTPNWQNGKWGSCINGTQTRTNTDGCGNTKIETQSCKSNNTLLYIGLAAAGIAVIYLATKKK